MPNRTAKLKVIIIFMVLMMSTSTSNLWSQSRVQPSTITFEDQRSIEHLIRTYFTAIENKDYAQAWNLTSSDAKKEYPKSEAIREHWGLNSVKLISIKRCLILPSEFTFDVPKDTPTKCFSVSLDIKPSSNTAWNNGLNERLVDVVKENGEWRIKGLNTGP